MQPDTARSLNPVKIIGITLLSIGLFAAWYFSGTITQDPLYHQFADQRTLLALPHAHNVLSNLPFCLVGLTGFYLVSSRRAHLREQAGMYHFFFAAVFFTAFGSAYYHLDPNNLTLVWDRLPMSIGFMSILAAIMAERIDAKLARALLPWLLLAGAGSVFYWHWLDDLRAYALVQFGSLLILLLILLRYRKPGAGLLWLALACYALAKLFEAADVHIFELSQGLVSGHALKHLAAAVAPLLILRRIKNFTRGHSARTEPAPVGDASTGDAGMINSNKRFFIPLLLLITAIGALAVATQENRLESFSQQARESATRSYYSENQGGYAGSAAEWTRAAFD